ncbi:cyclic nucleotide-binding domain-containing protein [Legionella sp. PATHC035]|uniref:cyclic nucleotide-binding domain-containing protein n=1 Tax=Legionella sp. PATHC035 TaxID=2992040 RepID=UPI0022435D94|nr:cyclic nucleotide-binding domain-containing protein [Legionella sp. PATHC035]MCW8410392.1 cyclic nucleotide-binding domain-containing protein [Legionella sp. PATHC035]
MDYLYSLGNILILLSLSFRKVLIIRTIFVLSDLSFLLYGALANVPPVAFWAIASLIINFVQIGILLRDMIPRDLPYDLQQIKDLFFSDMQTSDFIRLIKISSSGTSSNKKILTKGSPVENLMLITKGKVYIEVENGILELGPYHFIGEMSYFRDGKANTTIHAREPVDYLYWRYSDLQRLQERKPPLFMKMVEAMGKDIILKMLKQQKAPEAS